jgi:hypothetical protein
VAVGASLAVVAAGAVPVSFWGAAQPAIPRGRAKARARQPAALAFFFMGNAMYPPVMIGFPSLKTIVKVNRIREAARPLRYRPAKEKGISRFLEIP